MYRGSTSKEARRYKLAGHDNEDVFMDLIGGSSNGLPPQGKTDCVDSQGNTFSVKKQAKKWQVFLYGKERLKSDNDFVQLRQSGLDLSLMLDAFPEDYEKYVQDKLRAKSRVRELLAQDHSGVPLDWFKSLSLANNLYVQAKFKLSEINSNLAEAFSSYQLRARFFRKSFFNDTEVSHLAVQDGTYFHIFRADDVVDVFANHLSVSISGTGGHADDVSIAGQKLIMKTSVNVVELEVRNDSPKHYRQLRFNMNRDPAVDLLLATIPEKSRTERLIRH